MQYACMAIYTRGMGKVLQVRDVSDETYAALSRQAADRGLSLSQYLRRELDDLARIGDALAHNERVIRDLRSKIQADVTREEIVAALHEGRRERS